MDSRSSYPHFLAIPTRWKDNDAYGHVNNIDYYSFFDTVINHYLIKVGGLDIHRGAVIGFAAESHCKYLKSLAYPEVVDAGLRVTRLGNSSARYEIGLFREHDPEPAAEGWFVHVFVNRDTQKSSSIPDSIRTALTRLLVTPP